MTFLKRWSILFEIAIHVENRTGPAPAGPFCRFSEFIDEREVQVSMEKTVSQNLPQKLSDDIIRLIIDRHLKPGDRLPNETMLSQHLKAGRGSVREAMKLLVSRNIVEIRQGSGTYVSKCPGVCDDPLGLVFLDDSPKLVFDLMEIRILVEPSVAAMAARNADEDEIGRMICLCNEAEETISRGESHARLDILFHQSIACASKNMVAPRLMPVVNRTIKVLTDLSDPKCLREMVADHREIRDAIANRDPIAAKDAMYLHLVNRRRIFSKMLAAGEVPFCSADAPEKNRAAVPPEQ